MRRAWSSALVIAALAAGSPVLLTPDTAFAQGGAQPSEQDIAQARQLGQQAQAAFDAGNFAESEKLWNAARNLYPIAPTLTLGLARAEVKNGHYVSAQEHYNKIIREWGNHPNPPPAFAAAAESAKNEVGAVTPHIANVTISVEGPTSPTVTIDGQPVPVVALGLKRPVDPGSHTVHAEAPGWVAGDTTFQVTEGGNAEARLKLEKGAEPPPGTTPPAGQQNPGGGDQQPPAGGDKGGSSNKSFALVAFGVGAVGVVVGSITGLIAIGKHGSLKDSCNVDGDQCPKDKQDDVDSYHRMGTISTIGFIVGVVGVGAGAVLWLTAPKSESSASKKPHASPYIGLGTAGVGGTF